MDRQGDAVEITRDVFRRGYDLWRERLDHECVLGELGNQNRDDRNQSWQNPLTIRNAMKS